MNTADDEIAAIWQDAVAAYSSDTKRELSIVDLPKINSVDDLSKLIEMTGANFTTFRVKNQRLWHVLLSFALPLSEVCRISVTPISTLDFGAATSAVLGAVSYMLKACEGVANSYDWVEQVFKELQDFSERLGQYVSAQDAVLRKKITGILAVLLQIIGRSEKLIREQRFRQYLRVTFLGKDAETKKLVDGLNQLFGSEQRYVLGVTYATSQRLEQKADIIDNVVHQTADKVSKVLDIVTAPENRERKVVIDEAMSLQTSLRNTTASDIVEETYARNERSLLDGTATWLQKEELFTSWINGNGIILWILGGPGAGKSYLATWLIQRLRADGAKRAVAYFFVKESSETLRDANTILKTLAWQLLSQDAAFKNHAMKICRDRIHLITAEATWENLFINYYMSTGSYELKPVTLVIDGLDEATTETRRTVLTFLKDLTSSHNHHPGMGGPVVQLAIIGRGSLRSDLGTRKLESGYFIEVSRDKNQQDIDKYIQKRLGDLEILQYMRHNLKSNGQKMANKIGKIILKKVSKGADGVFLWAQLLLDELVNKDLPHIDAILDNPPSSLDEMICSVFNRLDNERELDREVMRKMLLLMTYSRRPLLFGELDLATSLSGRKPNYLLWRQTRGILSSVFELKFPEGRDPDLELSSNSESDGEDENSDEGDERENKIECGIVKGASAYADQSSDHPDLDSDYDDDSDSDSFLDNSLTSLSLSEAASFILGHKSRSTGTVNPLQRLSSDQLHTEVSFCHTRIRDYLVREGSPDTRRKPNLEIIPDLEDAQADITIICLEIFRLELSLDEEQKFLCDYPLCHLAEHLDKVNPKKTSQERSIKIISGLSWLFGTENGCLSLMKSRGSYDHIRDSGSIFWSYWVGTDRYWKVVQGWFALADDLRQFTSWDEDTISWMVSASTSYAHLLRPIMKAASILWFVRSGFDSYECVDKGEFCAKALDFWLSWVSMPPYYEETRLNMIRKIVKRLTTMCRPKMAASLAKQRTMNGMGHGANLTGLRQSDWTKSPTGQGYLEMHTGTLI
jgi:hypothetical protein